MSGKNFQDQSVTSSPVNNSARLATLGGIIACLIWSSAVFVTSSFVPAVGALKAAGIEMMFGGTFLLLVNAAQGKLGAMFAHSPKFFILCGSSWMLNLTLFWLALGKAKTPNEVVITGLINYLWPVLTLLLSLPILGKKARWLLIPGVLTAVAGIVLGKLAVTPARLEADQLLLHFNAVAYLLAFLDAIAWALYSNFSARYAAPAGSSPVALFMLTVSAPLYFAGVATGEDSVVTPWLFLLLLGWACTSGIAYLLWDIGMRKGNVVTISAFAMMTPLLSTVITASLTGVGLPINLLLAAGLVVVGSYVSGKGVERSVEHAEGDDTVAVHA
jgi:drug/metabolite transporter (DMT)-like permease